MTNHGSQDVTLSTLHAEVQGVREDVRSVREEVKGVREDVRGVRDEVKAAHADLKATLIAGFRGVASRESSEEMVRLLRESNRLQEERFTQLDVRIREQHLESMQVLHASSKASGC